jgi:hypothetical protein
MSKIGAIDRRGNAAGRSMRESARWKRVTSSFVGACETGANNPVDQQASDATELSERDRGQSITAET